MTPPQLPVLHLQGSPAELGRQHADQAAALIREAVPVRWQLCREATAANGQPRTEAEIRALAQACWDFHIEHFPALMEEVQAMAHRAEVDPLGLLIQNGYTDFRDCLFACPDGSSTLPEGCTSFAIRPTAARDGLPLIGQTWDMHRSALPFVVLLSLQPKDAPPALMISLAGCVGMIGMNAAGLAVCTNNLHARSGRIGAFWPFLMRQMLTCETTAEARQCLLSHPVAGGHNYLIMDASGDLAEIERLPFADAERTPGPYTFHTNHCLENLMAPSERIDSPIGRASSLARWTQASSFLQQNLYHHGSVSIEDLMQLTALTPSGETHSVCMRPVPDFDMQTCAALVMSPANRQFFAVKGLPSEGLHNSLPSEGLRNSLPSEGLRNSLPSEGRFQAYPMPGS